MRTSVTIDITVDANDERDLDRLEDELATWLMEREGVVGMRVLHQGDLSNVAWREARRREFGPRLRNPFARATLDH